MWTRRSFIRAFGAGLLSASMVRDQLLGSAPRIITELIPEHVTYKHVKYSMGFRVSKEMLEDDVYGDYITASQVSQLQDLIDGSTILDYLPKRPDALDD